MKELLKMIETLLEQGRGFNLQSHGTNAAGDEFYNFALYPMNKKKGSYYYFHSANPEEIVEKLKEFMVEKPEDRKLRGIEIDEVIIDECMEDLL